MEDVESFLHRKEKAELVEMLMMQILDDEHLRQRLVLQVARSEAKGWQLPAARGDQEP